MKASASAWRALGSRFRIAARIGSSETMPLVDFVAGLALLVVSLAGDALADDALAAGLAAALRLGLMGTDVRWNEARAFARARGIRFSTDMTRTKPVATSPAEDVVRHPPRARRPCGGRRDNGRHRGRQDRRWVVTIRNASWTYSVRARLNAGPSRCGQ